jgi:polyhydroxybutyrate depolymerase
VDCAGRYETSITSRGVTQEVIVAVPESASGPAPLVLVLHGFGGSAGEAEAMSGMTAVAEKEGLVVAYPQAAGFMAAWRVDPRLGPADVVFLGDAIAAVAAATPIDPSRVYAVGMSKGGGMVSRLACESPGLLAAVAPVAAAHPPDGCVPVEPVPAVAIHGTADGVVPLEGRVPISLAIPEWAEQRAAANGCEARPVRTSPTDGVGLLSWTGCEAAVSLFLVEGGGHEWPGSPMRDDGEGAAPLITSELVWNFFAGQTGR